MDKNLLSKKYLLTGLGLVALLGIILISYNGSQITKKAKPSPTLTAAPMKPKTAAMLKPAKDKPVTGQIIVKFKPHYTKAQINEHLKQYHASILKTIGGIDLTVVKVPVGQENAIMQQLKTDPYVASTQRDYTTHAFFAPNDQGFGMQYALDNIGQSIDGQPGIAHDDIHIQAAWDVTQGTGVKVAVLDTGIDLNQPDLAGKVITKKSFISNTVEDYNGHGTHVAGILAADTNNSIGVAGTCPGCQLIVGKILDNTGTGTTSNAVAGIVWAANQGAKVINLSLGTNDPQTASLYKQAVTYAINKGAVVVAAAGNNNCTYNSNPKELTYPAAITGVISVAATNNRNQRPCWSDYGTWVKLAAPGENILSTGPTYPFTMKPSGYTYTVPYMYMSGTSMAGPLVAGVAALVSTTQYGKTPQAIVNRLETTADKINGTGTYWTYGLVDAAKAVGPAPSIAVAPSTGITPKLYCVGGSGVPPCATIPPGSSGSSSTPSGANPSGAETSSAPSSSETNPSISSTPESNTSPSPSISGTPNNGGKVCKNVKVNNIFYNLSSAKQNTKLKIHIKCHSGGGSNNSGGKDNDNNGRNNNGGNNNGGGNSNGGGNNTVNPNNGWISKFIALLLQLLQQLIQLIEQCTGQTTNITVPQISITPVSSPGVSTTVSVSQPSVSNPAPSSNNTAPSAAPSSSAGAGASGFITAKGTQLMLNGKPYKSIGFNFSAVGSCWSGTNWTTSQMDTFFASLPTNSLARFFAPPGGTDSVGFVQSVVKEADKYHVHLIISLAAAAVYGQCDAADSDSTSGGKTAAYYTDAVKPGSPYANWVKSVVTALANDPGVAMWEIINEPWHNGASLSQVGGVAGATTYTNAAAALIRAAETAGAGKPKQLITLGPADIGETGGVSGMESIFKNIDVVDDHDYSGDLGGSTQYQSSEFPQLQQIAQTLNKPYMIDEAGVEAGSNCSSSNVKGAWDNGSSGLSLQGRVNFLVTQKATSYIKAGASAVDFWLYTGGGGGCTYENIGPSDPIVAAVKNFKMP